MRTITLSAVTMGCCALNLAAATASFAVETPWWNQEKIRFFWGQWHHFYEAGVTDDPLMESLSKVGTTVFVSTLGSAYDTHPVDERLFQQAAAAKKHGIRFFGRLYVSALPLVAKEMNAPLAIDAEGKSKWTRPDPFFKPAYEEWLLKPVLEMANSGLVDGVHIDWEFYTYHSHGSMGEGRDLYNDECFHTFLERQGISEGVPITERYRWLVEKKLRQKYLHFQRDLTEEMFRDLAVRVREVKPDFIFSSYDSFQNDLENGGWRSRGIAAGLHSPKAPYFVVDPRHYWDYSAAPWWDSIYGYHHSLGYKHISGTYDWRLFGGRPDTEISAVQWMVENAIHSDGFWVWTEREFGTYEWQAFAAADRRIKGIEQKVGKFLLHGQQDNDFVTTVEWSGNPEMDRRVHQRSYHFGQEHLVMVSNVDSFRPLQVRLRFPSLPAGSQWMVRGPVAGLYFSYEGRSARWDAKQLREGVVFPMEKRSEQFLWLLPWPNESPVHVSPADLVRTQSGTPLREGFDESPDGEAESASRDATGYDQLLFLKTESLGNLGGQGPWVIGSGIFSANLTAETTSRLRHGRGNCWSPSWSPDRQQILFTHYAQGRGQVFTMNADGTSATNLSRNPHCDKQPVWSPDGHTIAFVSDRDGNWEIFVMNADGSGQRRLTDSPGADVASVWSPDGQHIAFESDRGADTDIYIMKADGSGQRLLVSRAGDDLEPTWSPDGRQIAFTSPNAQVRALVIADVETGRLIIPDQGYHTWQVESPRWSPDGRYIAATYNLGSTGIALFDLTAGPNSKVETESPKGVVGSQELRGDEIPHERVFGQGRFQPYPGGGPFFRPGFPSWYAFGSAAPASIGKRFYGLSWSPDGKALAFSSDLDPTGAFYVYILPIGIEGEKRAEPRQVPGSSSAWPQEVMWGTR